MEADPRRGADAPPGAPPAPTGPPTATPGSVAALLDTGPGPVDEPWAGPSDGLDEAGDVVLPSATDPIDRVCPLLRSADGRWRSTRPDPDHRCTSQQPPVSLPTLAQERFCLTPSHVRCEWYRMAEATRRQSLERDHVPEQHLRNARFRPVVRSVPVALAPAIEGTEPDASLSGRTRIVAVAVFAAAALIVAVGLVLLAGGGSGPTATPLIAASPSPAASALTAAASATPTAAPTPTPEPTPRLVLYEVQRGERMPRIADRLGITREDIIAVNDDLGDPPRVEPGDVIILPLPPGSTMPPGATPMPVVP